MKQRFDMTQVWVSTLSQILNMGTRVAPRGKLTMELQQHTVHIDARKPVMMLPERNLSDRFLAAEAYWILSGDDTVAGIAPWNSRITQFSDDGETFFGAYGPKVVGQLGYVVSKLLADPDTRQAGLNIWRENPPDTKDVPCTVAIFFTRRGDQVNAHVFMRSNDAWLGLPYDAFNFAMLVHLVCARINESYASTAKLAGLEGWAPVVPGVVHLTAASSHLYEDHWEEARLCLRAASGIMPKQPDTGASLYLSESALMQRLEMMRSSIKSRWWRQ